MTKQNIAMALCRVSSLEQLESNSLAHQKDNVLKAAEQLGVTIPSDAIWSGNVSSKKGVNYDRKDLLEMLAYAKKHSNVKFLIVQEVDRFMRSPDEQVYWQIRFLNEVGVKIWYADKPELNKDDIYSGLMRYMEGFRAAGSNDERQRKSINGQTKAIEEGRFPFSPKPGYMKGRRTGIQEIHPQRGPILQQALLAVSEHQATPTEALRMYNIELRALGRPEIRMDKFRNLLTDPFYAGIVEINKQVQARNENGLHAALITKSQHLELVSIMTRKQKNQTGPRKGGNPKYPLNNIITCDDCKEKRNGRFVGLDLRNRRESTRIYEKYRCRGCNRYISRDEMHDQVQVLVNRMRIDEGALEKLTDALDIAWKRNEARVEQEKQRLSQRVDDLSRDINSHVMAAIDPSNLSIKDQILLNIETEKIQLAKIESELSNLDKKAELDRERFLKFAFGFINNIGSKFLELSYENRMRCKQILFPAGFFVDVNKKVYTPETSLLIRLAANKKAPEGALNKHLVRVQGL